MTTNNTRKGPGLSLPQRIGDQARSALYANKPDQWILGESPGDDFGYDFQVTAFDPAGEGAQCAFNIQLKGTTQSVARLKDGESLSYPFDHATLNLWHRSGFAVVVVIVDLIETQDPKIATVHYHLANYDLEEVLATIPADQKTVRLRVPTSQLVHSSLDILPIVLPYLDEIADARRIARDRRRAVGTSAPETVSIEATSPRTSAPLEDMLLGDELERLIDVSAKRVELKAALAALRAGDYERVLELCPEPSDTACVEEPTASAIVAHLRSTALDAIGDSDGAMHLAGLAQSLAPHCDVFVGAAAQKQLEAIDFGDEGQQARLFLLRSLTSHTGLSVATVKSKIFALNRNMESAREILKPFPMEKRAIVEIVVSIIEGAWERVVTEVNTARELPALRPKQRLILDVFEARAQFEQAFQSVPRPTTGEFIIPSTGLPQVNYDKLRLAYRSSQRAMLAAQRLNWPADIRHVLDVFPISAMLLGNIKEALPLMTSLGLARATITSVREVIAKIAVQCDQPEIALELHLRAGESVRFENEDSVVAVAALKSGQIAKALDFVTDTFLDSPSTKDVFLSSLLMLGMAANAALRPDLLEKIRTRLGSETEARHYRAILDSAVTVQQSVLQRSVAIENLYGYWSGNGHPTVVGYHLLVNTDPRDESEARLFLNIAADLEVENSLGAEQLADYGQALLTVGDIGAAVAKLRSASARFKDDPKIQSLLGVALEIDGQSAEAFQLFEHLLNEGKASDTAQRYFVEIAARMGFFDKAEQQVRAAFSKAAARDPKMRLLRTLFQLLLAEGNRPERTEEVAWEYGRLANQSDEREEGTFLQEYLVATSREDLTIKPERIDEFRTRLETYNTKFPNSRFLWRAELPVEGSPQDLQLALQKMVGLTNSQIEENTATERKMDHGLLEVPFSWRPRRFLRNIPDLFMLWEIRKRAPIERAALHFRNSIAGYVPSAPNDLPSLEAVISLTSLLLLDEIGLLQLVLDSFPRIIIARATLIALQEGRNTFTSGWGRQRSTRIMSELQRNFSKIVHPPHGAEANSLNAPKWFGEEKRAMQQDGRFYFSDDIVETFLVCSQEDRGTNKSSISTLDFLRWADQSAGLLSPWQVSDFIGRMIRLRVLGINVEQRYFVASIPDALNEAKNQAEAEEALGKAQTLRSILDSVWNHARPFEELSTHFASNMVVLLTTARASDEVLVSLWLSWLGVVRFQKEPNHLPIKKMVLAFFNILIRIESNSVVVGRLWKSLWTAVQRGLGNELTMPEDRAVILEAAAMLGTIRAMEQHEPTAMELFEKAKLGLEAGTDREAWFSKEYIEAMVRKEKTKKANR